MKKAVKSQKRLRMALSGASGSGKTRSALEIAKYLGPRIGLLDTEYKSASAYADKVEFDVDEIVGDYHPDRLVSALEKYGPLYDVLIVDSLTHFWNGKGGMLDLADQEVKKMIARGGKADTFAAWKQVTPLYNKVVQALLNCPCHVIVTMRAKQEYSREGGKVTKLGVSPEMRDGFQYELDVEGMLDGEHNLIIGKTRFDALDGKMFNKPGKEVAQLLMAELSEGAAIDLTKTPPPTDPPPGEEVTAVIPKVNVFQAIKLQLESAIGNSDALKEAQQAAIKAQSEKMITQAEYSELGKIYLKVKNGAA